MCYILPVMLRERCVCAISGWRASSSAAKNPLSPIIPAHTRRSPVSPIIPALTQNIGGGGYQKEVREAKEVEEVKEANHRRVFLRPAFTRTSITIVGAPTFSSLRVTYRLHVQPDTMGRRDPSTPAKRTGRTIRATRPDAPDC